MDGIHDLGGRQGFGAVDVNEKEEQFHAPWEARVRGMVNAMGTAPDWNIDWFRHCREMMDPVTYLDRPYFDQWLQSYCAMMINSGVATVEECATGKMAFMPENVSAPMPAEDVATFPIGRRNFVRDVDEAPRFAIGDTVRTQTHGITGHTRLPAYARNRIGVIESWHEAHIFPDTKALGEDTAEALYTVSFALGDLFAESAGSKDRVSLDLWESYLEPA